MTQTPPARPRIALLGFRLESNSHAPVCGAEEFDVLDGEALGHDLGVTAPRAPMEMTGFADEMSATGDWEPVPLSVVLGGAAGPVDSDFFDEWCSAVLNRLDEVGPVDGVYFAEHGAAIATRSEDPDGDFFAAVRERVGSAVPMVATLDSHANVGARMAAAVDGLIAYRTNPHVDMDERGREAARLMRDLLAGRRVASAFVKIPFIPPSIAQNTKDGPLGEHIAFGQTFVGDEVAAVSVCSGFSLGDTVKNGMSVVATGAPDAATSAARQIAERIWSERGRYKIDMTPLDEAVAMMRAVNADPSRPSLCFADVADNPGGGGRGNTTHILGAFMDAGCRDALLAPFFDAPLAEEAHRLGVGATFEATFNRGEDSPFSEPLSAAAEVVALHDGIIVGRRGIRAGRTIDMGPTALLRCAGIQVLVTAKRVQFCDPAMTECVGVGLADCRGLIVKSRGHFRASVDEVFTHDRIVEVDVPGLTTPALERVDWQRVPRPIYPLDTSMTWTPDVQLV